MYRKIYILRYIVRAIQCAIPTSITTATAAITPITPTTPITAITAITANTANTITTITTAITVIIPTTPARVGIGFPVPRTEAAGAMPTASAATGAGSRVAAVSLPTTCN